jgi:hypothetical protein
MASNVEILFLTQIRTGTSYEGLLVGPHRNFASRLKVYDRLAHITIFPSKRPSYLREVLQGESSCVEYKANKRTRGALVNALQQDTNLAQLFRLCVWQRFDLQSQN